MESRTKRTSSGDGAAAGAAGGGGRQGSAGDVTSKVISAKISELTIDLQYYISYVGLSSSEKQAILTEAKIISEKIDIAQVIAGKRVDVTYEEITQIKAIADRDQKYSKVSKAIANSPLYRIGAMSEADKDTIVARLYADYERSPSEKFLSLFSAESIARVQKYVLAPPRQTETETETETETALSRWLWAGSTGTRDEMNIEGLLQSGKITSLDLLAMTSVAEALFADAPQTILVRTRLMKAIKDGHLQWSELVQLNEYGRELILHMILEPGSDIAQFIESKLASREMTWGDIVTISTPYFIRVPSIILNQIHPGEGGVSWEELRQLDWGQLESLFGGALNHARYYLKKYPTIITLRHAVDIVKDKSRQDIFIARSVVNRLLVSELITVKQAIQLRPDQIQYFNTLNVELTGSRTRYKLTERDLEVLNPASDASSAGVRERGLFPSSSVGTEAGAADHASSSASHSPGRY